MLLLTTVGALAPTATHACSCKYIAPDAALSMADAAFVGVVVAVRHEAKISLATFRIERIWKGPPSETIEVGVDVISSCAAELQIGERHLVYAKPERGDRILGDWSGLTINQCSSRLVQYAREDLKYLAEIPATVPAASRATDAGIR